MSAASSISKSSCSIFIFHHLAVSPNNSVIPPLCHCAAPSYFNLSSHNLTFSHSLYKYLSLSLSFPPLSPACFWREQGNLPSPVDVNTHSRLGVLQLQELTDQAFYCHTGLIEDICTDHSIKTPCCQTQTHLSANKTEPKFNFTVYKVIILCDVSVCPLFPQNNTAKHNYSFISYLAEWQKCILYSYPRQSRKTTMQPFYASTFYDFLISLGGPNGLRALQNYT